MYKFLFIMVLFILPQSSHGNSINSRFTVAGVWFNTNENGSISAIQGAYVEVYEANYNTLFCTTYTGSDGSFICERDLGGVTSLSLYAVIHTDNNIVKIKSTEYDSSIYQYQSGIKSNAGQTRVDLGNLIIPKGNSENTAFYMYNKIIYSDFYIRNTYDLVINELLSVIWSEESVDGAFYTNNTIWLIGVNGREPDVLLHEYGHFVVDHVYGYLPDAGGSCSWDKPGPGPNCALTEGYPTFLQAVWQRDEQYCATAFVGDDYECRSLENQQRADRMSLAHSQDFCGI